MVASSADPLAWLSEVLWPDGEARLVAGKPPQNGSAEPWWWASPNTGTPQLLIPADSMAAAGTAVRRYHDGFDLKRWARSAAAELAMTRPAAAHRLLDGQSVVLDGPPDAIHRGVLGGLRDLLKAEGLRFAVSLARPKSNRKPVIQIINRDGAAMGWAKIGWTPWTEELVGNEAHWLTRPAHLPVITPALMEDVVLAGRRAVVTSAVAPSRRPRLRRDRVPGPEVLRAIADRGTRSHRAVQDSRWWASVEDVLDVAEVDERAAIERAVDRADGLTFSLGAWHGDFTPWNVMTIRDLTAVIDWELAADEVPFGFDLCHHNTQVAAETLGLSARDAIDRSARVSPLGLDLVGVEPGNRSATWNLYLVELIRRTLALRAAGLPTDDVHFGRAATERLGGAR